MRSCKSRSTQWWPCEIPIPTKAERDVLDEPALGHAGVVTETARWGRDAKAVYVDLVMLGYDRSMKNGGAHVMHV